MTSLPKPSSNFERHAQTGIAVIAIALLTWIGNNAHTSSIDLATLKTEIAGLKTQIEILQRTASNGYTRSDATRDFAIRDENIRENREAINRIFKSIYDGSAVPR